MQKERKPSDFWKRLEAAYCAKYRGRFTQDKAGKLIGKGQNAAKKWVYGGYPSMDNCIIIAKKLKVTVDWLYTGRGDRSLLTKDEIAALKAFRAIEDADKQHFALGWLEAHSTPKPQRKKKRTDLPDGVRDV